MSKKNNNPFKIVATTLVAFAVLLTNSTAWGQLVSPRDISVSIGYISTDCYTHTGYYSGGTTGYFADWIHFFPRTCTYYDGNVANTGNTWNNSNLITSKGRYLSHIEPGTLTHPPSPYEYTTGTSPYHTDHVLNDVPAVIEAYWRNNGYSSYTKVSGPDPSRNCHGYSTGKNVWLDDFKKLMDDDYSYIKRAEFLWSGAIVGAQVFGPGGFPYYDHSIRIDGVDLSNSPLSFKIVSIREKCRDSGMYEKIINKTFRFGIDVELDSWDVPMLNGSLEGFYLEK